MKARTFAASIAAMSLMASGALLAQERTPQPRTQDRPTMDRPKMDHPGFHREALHHIGDIHGTNVMNFEGETLGKIDSLVIDTQNGKAKYAVLSVGGFLGVGDRQYAVPWHAFELRPLNQELFLEMTKDQIERAPSFERDQWPNWGDQQWKREIDQHFPARRVMPGERRGQTEPMPGERRGQQEDDRYADTDPTASMFVRSTNAIGMDVQDTRGEKVGTCTNLVMDLHDATIVYAVVGHGGVLGMGRTNVAVPWEALTVRGTDPDEQVMVVDIDLDRLRQAPEYDENVLPQRRHVEWARDLFPARERPGMDPRREMPGRDMPQRNPQRDRDEDRDQPRQPR